MASKHCSQGKKKKVSTGYSVSGLGNKIHVGVKTAENNTEYKVPVIMVRVDEGELDAGGNSWHCCGLDREADKTENDAIGVFETGL